MKQNESGFIIHHLGFEVLAKHTVIAIYKPNILYSVNSKQKDLKAFDPLIATNKPNIFYSVNSKQKDLKVFHPQIHEIKERQTSMNRTTIIIL